jgi:hypothetical protein
VDDRAERRPAVRTAGQVALVLLALLAGFAATYSATRYLDGPARHSVPPVDLDDLPADAGEATTTSTAPTTTIAPGPPTPVTPPVTAATVPPATAPPALPPADVDDDDDDGPDDDGDGPDDDD